MDILADTVFLIDLWRESRAPGRATLFARAHVDLQVGICWVVAAEFLGGALAAGQDAAMAESFLSRYAIVHSGPAIVRTYARLYAELRSRSNLIGPNDLWIAAAATSLDLPLLTRNANEFRRVQGLRVVEYLA